MHIPHIGRATIRQTVAVSKRIERETGERFLHFELGSPGLPPEKVGIEAQKAALDRGVASSYPDINGIPELKAEASRFVKAFLDIDISPAGFFIRHSDLDTVICLFVYVGFVCVIQ